MKEDPLAKLRRASKRLTKPYHTPFTSPHGREGYKCFSPFMGYYEIHICETREDAMASNLGRW
jgi:hypothetical protein